MWFKNLQVYDIDPAWTLPASEVEERLERHPLLPVNQASMQSVGWVAPAPGTGLVYRQEQQMLIALGIEQRVLPGAVIKREVEKKAAEVAEQQGFAPGRKQLRELRDAVIDELRPRAFVRSRTVRAWLDLDRRRVVIDSTSPRLAEELGTVLRADLGDLPAYPMDTQTRPASAMTAWVSSSEAPPYFALNDTCELRADNAAKSNVRYQRHQLDGPEIRSLISGGKFVARLGLGWRERLDLVLTDRGELKRLRVRDVTETASERRPDADAFDADFALMTGNLGQMIDDLTAALGGRPQS